MALTSEGAMIRRRLLRWVRVTRRMIHAARQDRHVHLEGRLPLNVKYYSAKWMPWRGPGPSALYNQRQPLLQQPSSPSATLHDYFTNADIPVSEFLESLHDVNVAQLQAPQIVNLVQCLLIKQYSSLLQIPWLQEDIHVARIQLVIMDQLKDRMSPVLNHPAYADLLLAIQKQVNHFEPENLSQMLLALLCMGVDPTHPIIRQLLSSCHDRLDEFSVEALATLTDSYGAISRSNLKHAHKILHKFQALLENSQTELSRRDLVNLSRVVINMMPFSSRAILRIAMQHNLRAVQDPNTLADPNVIGACLRMNFRFLVGLNNDKNMKTAARNVILKCGQMATENIKSLKAKHIGIIFHYLQMSRCFDKGVQEVAQRHSLSLLTDDTRLCDITNLMFTLTRDSSESVKKEFFDALAGNMDKIDVLLLSHLAMIFMEIGVDSGVLQQYQRHIANLAPRIVQFDHAMQKITKHLMLQKFVDGDHEKQFVDTLTNCLSNEQGLSVYRASSAVSFLLSSSQESLPHSLVDKIANSLPKWRPAEFYQFSFGLNTVRRPVSVPLQKQVGFLQNKLYETLEDKIGEITALSQLYRLALGLILHSRRRDPSLAQKILDRIPALLSTMNDADLVKVSSLYAGLYYHDPEVVDKMTAYVIENKDTIDSGKLLALLKACANSGYSPAGVEQLSEVVISKFGAMKTQDVCSILEALFFLGMIQVAPEQQLSEVFTLDFLQLVDRYIAENPESKRKMERMVAMLNRNVVIESPQLNVPWFSEHYFRTQSEKDQPMPGSFNKQFLSEVHQVLKQILGSDTFIHQNSRSQYYHSIDFECVMDYKGMPVEFEGQVSPGWRKGLEHMDLHQRVAINCLSQSMYGFQSTKLKGQEQLRQRHLQILGYKVVEVPHFEWFSMGLASWNDKVKYLQGKLFSSSRS